MQLRAPAALGLIAAALALAAGAATSSCGRTNSERSRQKGPPPAPVHAAQVELRDVPLQVRAIGTVEPVERVEVKAQVAGQLVRVLFEEGSDVRKGQPLFEIDPRTFQQAVREADANVARSQAQMREAEAGAERAEAEARRAEAELNRFAPLAQKGIISRLQMDQVRTAAEAARRTAEQSTAAIGTARAAVRAAEAQLADARLQLSYATIRAPISGKTGSLTVRLGNLVTANADPPLVVINQMSPIYVSFTLPERTLDEVRSYASVRKLRVDAVPGSGSEGVAPVSGTLDFIDNSVDEATGTIRLKARFGNESRLLWPGRFVNVSMTLTTESALVIPIAALQRGQEGSYVFVVRADRTAEQRRVEAAREFQQMAVITTGLNRGETVVTRGQSRVTPGGPVRMADAAANRSQAP